MMVELVTENTPLIEELRQLLIMQDEKHDKARQERIEELQEKVGNNLRTRLANLQQNIDAISKPVPKKDRKTVYRELLTTYRDAMQVAKECSTLKKQLRAQGVRA